MDFHVSRHKGLKVVLNASLGYFTVESIVLFSAAVEREWPWVDGSTKPNINCLPKLEQKVEKLVFKGRLDAAEIAQSVKC